MEERLGVERASAIGDWVKDIAAQGRRVQQGEAGFTFLRTMWFNVYDGVGVLQLLPL